MITWDDVRDHIYEFHHMKDDWDSYGAAAPSLEQVDAAMGFARAMERIGHPVPRDVYPLPDGNVVFEWQMGGEDDLIYRIEVEKSGWGTTSFSVKQAIAAGKCGPVKVGKVEKSE